ncbi:uncharacterized protein PG998_006801 [Apiospora kogelbergensis]|uniref:uncharacterized protein n=1 Tax=Apiospora kogelbergensis TaxID=1337665 RepID=UPI00313010DF
MWGVLQTAIVQQNRHDDQHGPFALRDVVRVCILLLGVNAASSTAAHAWDDIVDAPLDRQMARSRNRPVARGAVGVRAALAFAAAQALAAALVLLLLLPRGAAVCALPSAAVCVYYPLAKRHTHLPQLVLGLGMGWGVVTGSAGLAGGPAREAWADAARLALVAACALWTVVYDTIYARIDVAEDLRLGLGSTAVLFRRRTKPFLGWLLGAMGVSLWYCGFVSDMGLCYYLVAVGGSCASIGWMIYQVDLDSTKSCYRWFSRGFWLPALAITVGLGLELAASPMEF